MDTLTLILIFVALCGTGILLSVAAPVLRQGNVLAWLGCLGATALVLAGADALFGGNTFSEPLWTLPGLAATLTLKMDALSAVFILVTGLVLFPASIFAGGEVNRMASTADGQNGRAFAVMMFGLYLSIALIFLAGDTVLF
ncbi:MAG: hypothetical protein WCE58_07875, partial [Gallionella sp.]